MIRRRQFLFAVIIVSLGGCGYPDQGTRLDYDGEFNESQNSFHMDGYVELTAVNPVRNNYNNITVEFYARNGTLLHKERLGSLQDRSDRLKVSVRTTNTPYYIIFDSPDIWTGKDQTSIVYYTRSETGYQGYQLNHANKRSDLPVTPSG